MIKVYQTDVGTEWDDADLKQHLSALPSCIKDKILRYRGWKERQSRIAGKLLLQRLIKDFGLQHSLRDLQYTAYHKPFFAGGFDFSIAHSGDMVICAGTVNGNIGADIELMKAIEVTDYREQLHPNEWQTIQNTTYQQKTFYEIWTKKEAWLKAIGRGVDMDLAEIDVCGKAGVPLNPLMLSSPQRVLPEPCALSYKGLLYQIHSLTDIRDYAISIATSAPFDSGSISFERLSDPL